MPAPKTGMWSSGRTGTALGAPKFLSAQRAFELVLRPFDHVVDLFIALGDLGDHDRVDRLVVDLGADFGTRRRAGDRGLLVAARRIAINGADRRLDRLPGIEVVHGLERRQVVAERRL